MGNTNVRKDLLPENGHFIIHFVRAIDVPKTDSSSDLNLFVCAYIIDKNKEVVLSNTVQTTCVPKTCEPVWSCFRDLKVNPPNGSFLRCEIIDAGLMNPEILGHTDIPINEYWDEEEHTFSCDFHSFSSQEKNSTFSLVIRRRFLNNPPPQRQVFFIIRHGESIWNQAQSSRNVAALIQYDHSLTEKGIEQADNVNAMWKREMSSRTSSSSSSPPNIFSHHPIDKDFDENDLNAYYTERFLKATNVFSSPLTRAIQTALVALKDHPAMVSNGLTLYSNIREIKAMAGLDTVGSHYGDDIHVRVCTELEKVVGAKKADLYSAVNIDVNDAHKPWWTSQLSYDSDKEVADRIEEFLIFARYYPKTENDTCIYVGHSMFFKNLCKRTSDVLSRRRSVMSEKMRKYKLANGAVMALTVKYTDDDGKECDPLIEDADLLFDSTFHVH